MEKYSVFERGMHWIILIFILLEGAYYYSWMPNILNLDQGGGWELTPLEMIVQSLFWNLKYIFFFVVYLFLFFFQRKTKKNISIFFTVLFVIIFILKYSTNSLSFTELKTILNYLLFIVFCLSVFNSRKIEKRERYDGILDME